LVENVFRHNSLCDCF